MSHRYLPLTAEDRRQMLADIGVSTVDDLFTDIPEQVRLQRDLHLPRPLDEFALAKHMRKLAEKNADLLNYTSFLGAGTYEHYIPSVVDHVLSRSEFYTAYTPYQPEISQGELQAVFEFQTMICELTGMDVANSSMYDGPTALAEAAAMAYAIGQASKIVVSQAVHPEARSILRTYAKGLGMQVVEVETKAGLTDWNDLEQKTDADTAAVIVQHPNFFGYLEDLTRMEQITHSHTKSMMVVSSNPLALGVLQPPGAFGADIVVGDTQPFGIPAAYGGPHCGYFAVREKHMRKVPGRLVGQTTDKDGKRGFVMTLQTREQHIRREKATSNICSNQALNAIASAVAMTALGKNGVQEMGRLNIHKAHYAQQRLQELEGVEIVFKQPFFNEFVIKLNRPVQEVNLALLEHGFVGGYDLEGDYPGLKQHMLIAVTETRTKEDMDQFARCLEGILHGG